MTTSDQAHSEHSELDPFQPGLRKQQLSWDEICRRAAKVVSFIDLAGHERYLKVCSSLNSPQESC